MTDHHYDVIIIGTGAGGGTLAYHLAPSGKRILILERGDYVPREKDNWNPQAVNVDAKYNTKESWLDKDGNDLHPHTNYYVGGNTKFYGAALFRLRKEDFGELRHHGGVSPAWPISYAELEPYYTQAEYLYQVHGNRGEDPTEPLASAPYRFPAVSHEPRIQHLADDFSRSGLKPFHVPVGVMLDEKNSQKSRCIRCSTCDGFPCLVSAKSDAQVICIDEAVKCPNCHPPHSVGGKAPGNRCFRAGSERSACGTQRQPGDLFSGYGCHLVWCHQLRSALAALRK
jgi:choline dehydrogenase-like flavoprotein